MQLGSRRQVTTVISTRTQRWVSVVVAASCISCSPGRTPDAGESAASMGSSVQAVPKTDSTPPGICATPAGGIRLGLDSVAGMPTNVAIAALRQRCAAVRVDSVAYAGFASPALRFAFAGATIWAAQNIPNTDTLVESQLVDHWEAVGDSLRFPDGRLIPRRLGQIRATDSLGIMFINAGDNTEGAEVTLCRLPGLTFFFDTLPAPADTSVRPFAAIRATDSLVYRHVEQTRDTLVLNTTRRLCHTVGVT